MIMKYQKEFPVVSFFSRKTGISEASAPTVVIQGEPSLTGGSFLPLSMCLKINK